MNIPTQRTSADGNDTAGRRILLDGLNELRDRYGDIAYRAECAELTTTTACYDQALNILRQIINDVEAGRYDSAATPAERAIAQRTELHLDLPGHVLDSIIPHAKETAP